MARKEAFDKVALRMLQGTPFSSGEFYRIIQSTGIGEYVKVQNNQVVKFTREPHDDEQPVQRAYKSVLKRAQTEVELRGVVSMDGTPVEYYGTVKGWEKFKSEWNS